MLIKNLYECKGNNAWHKGRIKVGQRTALVAKLRKFGMVDMLTGSVMHNFRHFQ